MLFIIFLYMFFCNSMFFDEEFSHRKKSCEIRRRGIYFLKEKDFASVSDIVFSAMGRAAALVVMLPT